MGAPQRSIPPDGTGPQTPEHTPTEAGPSPAPDWGIPAFLERLPRRVLLIQLVVMALFTGLHMLISWPPEGTYPSLLRSLLSVDYEMSLPNWFASTQFALLALTFLALAFVERRLGGGRYRRLVWICGAAIALYFSADDAAIIHERLGTIFEELFESSPQGSLGHALMQYPSYYWVLVYAPVFVPVITGLAIYAWRELGRARRPALLGIFVWIYAAVGLDFIEGYYGSNEAERLALTVFGDEVLFDIFLMEEVLEMLGVALILYAFLRHLHALSERPARVTVSPCES